MAEMKVKFRETLFDNELFKPNELPYPTQSQLPPARSESKYAGELRGYYGSDQFKARSSDFGLVRRYKDGTPRKHMGLDIYAPQYSFPQEISVVAIAKGTIEQRYWAESPNDLGNRVIIYPAGMKGVWIAYGHLARFHGHGIDVKGKVRKVEPGDVIGYAGCSGNAAAGTECSTIGGFNVNSGHIHLIYGEGKEEKDPKVKLGWQLRFSGAPFDKEVSLRKWKADGHFLAEPVQPKTQLGFLRFDIISPKGSKDIVDLARISVKFDIINLDNANEVSTTLDFYNLAAARLKDKEPELFLAKFHQKALEEFGRSATKLGALKKFIQEKSDKLQEIMTKDDEKGRMFLEIVLSTYRALFLAMGGEALAKASEHPLSVNVDNKPKREDLPKSLDKGCAPRCGIGLNGQSFAVRIDRGQVVMHAATLYTKPEGVAAPSLFGQVLSVSFGAGSPDQAIFGPYLSKHLAAELSAPDFGDPAKIAVAQLEQRIRLIAYDVAELLKLIASNSQYLLKQHKQEDDNDLVLVYWAKINVHIKGITENIEKISTSLSNQAEFSSNLKLLVLRGMAELGRDCCKVALEAFDPEKKDIMSKTSEITAVSLEYLTA